MNYRDGNLFLDEKEVELLSLTFMSDVETSYPAPVFIHGLSEVQAGATAHIQEIAQQNTPERRRSLQIDILKQLISICEEFKNRGYAAAQATGSSIHLH